MDDKMIKRISELTAKASEARGYILAMAETVQMLEDLDGGKMNPKILKKQVGVMRDMGLKFIEHGQNFRRLADLIEPTLDDVIKGETP